MLLEEYRLHAELFGRGRFLAFPIFTAAVVAGGVWLLSLTGSSLGWIVAGLHALVFFFGLQVGTIGLIGRDALRDVLGDVTLLVFSARTLPVSRRRLLGVFVWKDIVYYLAFFLTPVVIGFVPAGLVEGMSISSLGLLWLTIAGTFALGTATSLSLAGIASRNKALLILTVAVLAAAVIVSPTDVIALTPYAVYSNPGVTTLLVSSVVLALVLVAGPLLFEPTAGTGLRRSDPATFRRLRSTTDVYTARSLIELFRSSGSVWKVAVSLGILFAVTAFLLDRLATTTALEPSGGIAFGTLLGLGTFTTYNWVTQFDDRREFLRYPDGLDRVFRGKLRAFFICSFPVGIVYLGIAGYWYPTVDLLLGVVVFPLVSMYVFGLTAYLTGFSASELLFDTPLFAVYSAGLVLLSVPLLVSALAYGTAPLWATGISLGIAAGGAVVGLVLLSQTPDRWHERLRQGG